MHAISAKQLYSDPKLTFGQIEKNILQDNVFISESSTAMLNNGRKISLSVPF